MGLLLKWPLASVVQSSVAPADFRLQHGTSHEARTTLISSSYMSRSYKFHDPDGTYFITFATVEWVCSVV